MHPKFSPPAPRGMPLPPPPSPPLCPLKGEHSHDRCSLSLGVWPCLRAWTLELIQREKVVVWEVVRFYIQAQQIKEAIKAGMAKSTLPYDRRNMKRLTDLFVKDGTLVELTVPNPFVNQNAPIAGNGKQPTCQLLALPEVTADSAAVVELLGAVTESKSWSTYLTRFKAKEMPKNAEGTKADKLGYYRRGSALPLKMVDAGTMVLAGAMAPASARRNSVPTAEVVMEEADAADFVARDHDGTRCVLPWTLDPEPPASLDPPPALRPSRSFPNIR